MSSRTSRDPETKALSDYPRPSVAVDTAVLTLDDDFQLMVLQVARANGTDWALPGTFLHENEVLAEAVDRSLRLKANVRGLRPRQLHVFDALSRDERGWVLSVAHIQVAQARQLRSRWPDRTRLMPARTPGELPFDHPDIVKYAVEDLEARYLDMPDPDHLLGREFTLLELRKAHEAVAGEGLQRDNFRRSMIDQLKPTETTIISGRGRPAELFQRKSARRAR